MNPVYRLALALMLISACRSNQVAPKAVDEPAPEVTTSVGTTQARDGQATLLLTADIRGVLRPCGCTLELQKGGFDRLKPHLDAERARYPGAAVLHAGPLFYEGATVAEKKRAQRKQQVKVAADLIKACGVDAAALTAVDLAASGGKVLSLLDQAGLKPLASNLTLNVHGKTVEPWIVREVGDLRVGVIALASAAHQNELGTLAVVEDPKVAAQRAVKALEGRSDVVVLLSALGLRQTKRLLRSVPGIHFTIVGGLGEHPVVSDEVELVGTSRLMQFHREGRFIGRLSIQIADGQTTFVDASAPTESEIAELNARVVHLQQSLKTWRAKPDESKKAIASAEHHLKALEKRRAELTSKAKPVPPSTSSFSFHTTALNWDLPQDKTVLAKMDAFDEELKAINLANAGTLPEPKPGQAVYVGVAECLSCHPETETYWEKDFHAHAWETLVEQKKTFDAECVSCHVTGYGKAGGSLLGQTKDREDVQCEACHGPGSIHAESEDIEDIVAKPGKDLCVTCHNAHHSPQFDFAKWRKQIIVPGHGLPAAH